MFYGTFRDRVMLVQELLHLRGYDVASARAALRDLDHALTGMKAHGVELIVIGGSVLSFAYDRATLLERLREASHKLGVPVTTDMEATVQMMQHARVHTLAVAHRLNGLDDKALTDYLTAAGFAVEGIVGPQLVIASRAGSATDENSAFALTGEAAGQTASARRRHPVSRRQHHQLSVSFGDPAHHRQAGIQQHDGIPGLC